MIIVRGYLLLAFVLVSSAPLLAANLTWTNSAGTGNWNTDPNWTGLVWNNATPDNALFQNRSETVNLTMPTTVGTLTVNNGGNQSGAHNLILNGNTLMVGSIVMNGRVTGNVDSLADANNQKLTFNNTNVTASGNFSTTRGSVQMQGTSVVNIAGALTASDAWNNLILQNTASLTVSNGVDFRVIASNLDLNGGTLTTSSIWGNTYSNGTTKTNFNGTKIVATVDNADFLKVSNDGDGGAHSGTANLAAGGMIFDTNNHAVGITNRLVGVGGVTKQGTGTLTLSGANSYTGGTTINQGTLNVTSDAALGAAPSAATTNITFSGNGTLQAGSASVALQGTRNVAINSGVTATFDTNSNTMFVGAIGGASAAGLTKIGAGTLVLSAANTYGGTTTITGGTLQLASTTTGAAPTLANGSFESPALGSGFVYVAAMSPAQQAALVWAAGGNGASGGPALQVNGSAWGYPTVPNGTQSISLQRDSFVEQTLSFSAAGYYTLAWQETRRSTQVNPYTLALNGVTIGNFTAAAAAWAPVSTTFYVATPGNYTLRFAGTVTGSDVSVSLDQVVLSGTAGGQLPSTTNVNITGASGILDLNGQNQTIASLAGVAGSQVWLGSGTLTINPTSGSTNFAGVISGSGALTKSGAGTQTLSGANIYSGATRVEDGTLEIATGGSIANTPSVTVGVGSGIDTLLLTNTGTHTLGTGDLTVGSSGAGSGVVNHNAGNVTVGDAATDAVRIGFGAQGTYNINNGATSTLNVGPVGGRGNVIVGQTTAGFFNVGANATVNVGDLIVGQFAGSTGTVNQTGGVINVTNTSTMIVGDAGTGIENHSGGTTNVAGNLILGNQSTGNGAYNLSQGVSLPPAILNVSGNVSVGAELTSGTGVFAQSGGTHNVVGNLTIGNSNVAAVQNSYTLSGGTLNFGDRLGGTQFTAAPGNPASTLNIRPDGAFNFNGGTLMNVTNINTDSGSGSGSGVFTQNGGRFVIGVDGGLTQNVGGPPAESQRAMTTIFGDYDQNPGSTLAIDVFGNLVRSSMTGERRGPTGPAANPITSLITDSDLVWVQGDATLDGTLQINLNGVNPGAWAWYDVLVADNITITDGKLDLVGLSHWRIITDPSNPNRQILQVAAPEPASIALWSGVALLLAGVYFIRRRKT